VTGGYRWGFGVAAIFILAAVGVAVAVLRRDDVPAAAVAAPGPAA
jgi:hypothetical protein